MYVLASRKESLWGPLLRASLRFDIDHVVSKPPIAAPVISTGIRRIGAAPCPGVFGLTNARCRLVPASQVLHRSDRILNHLGGEIHR